ncbi:MAG: ribosome-associated translation inhibitor RaiA [Clostridia bacterium]|nr:ribosome-associated translation inhibitor RaiA [Clostridia bacterium]
MKLVLTGRKMEISDAVRGKAEQKLGKLNKFFPDEVICNVTIRPHKKSKQVIVEATISHNSMIYRGEASGEELLSCFDRVEELLERQIRKNKTRLEKRLRSGSFSVVEATEPMGEEEEEKEFKIVRTKSVQIKPMSVEEAILQMNLLGHTFFLFQNADTLATDLVYRRKDGGYGLMNTQSE